MNDDGLPAGKRRTRAGRVVALALVIGTMIPTGPSTPELHADNEGPNTGFVDEFLGESGSAPGRMWTTRSGTDFDSGIETYQAGNVFLDGNGHLVIQAIRDTTGAYTSGSVWTKNNLTLGYGTISARIKMPTGQGLLPSFWLMGADSDIVGWPASGEIDIAELPSTSTMLYSTLHGPIEGTTDTQYIQLVTTQPDLSTDYHSYWVRHLENQITFGVDNQTLATLTPDSLGPGQTWVYNRPTYAILNLQVGGPWAGAPDDSTPSTAWMLVDSVTFDPLSS